MKQTYRNSIYEENQQVTHVSQGGIGVTTLLTLIFVVLKLCHVIDWSWFWVLFPTILSFGLMIFVLIVVLIYVLIVIHKE